LKKSQSADLEPLASEALKAAESQFEEELILV
jgi:hypothetical protein